MKAKKEGRKLLQIQTSEDFERKAQDFIENLAKDIEEKRIPLSSLVRENFERERQEWLKHPYVCLNARHLLYVNEDLDYQYFVSEKLKSNMYLDQLSMKIAMKEEKIKFYLEELGNSKNTARDFQNLWKEHGFSLSMDDQLLEDQRDNEGLTSKSVKFSRTFHANMQFQREGFVVLPRYGEWKEKSNKEIKWDYSQFSIDIPTRNIQIIVIIDSKIYNEELFGKDFMPDISFNITNREGYEFSQDHMTDLLKIEGSVFERFTNISAAFSKDKHERALKGKDKQYAIFLKTLKLCIDRLNSQRKRFTSAPNFDEIILPQNYSFLYFRTPVLPNTISISVRWPYPKRKK